nr:putative ribonuclease h protein [Quercus suber]
MWLKDDGCTKTIRSAWNSSSGPATMPLIAKKIKKCGELLTEWSLQSFGCVRKQIEDKGKKLTKAEESVALGVEDYEVVKRLKAELNELLDKESLMWQQRARTLFLKCGDRNTSYFHSKASHRFRRNKILGIRDSANAWCTDEKQIKDIASSYFLSLFASSQPSDLSDILSTDRNCWKREIIDEFFLPHEASMIMAIPLSQENSEDLVFWPRNSNGKFSVKSGYKLLMECDLVDYPTTSDLTLTKKVWNGIWSLQTPNRVKALLWRAGRDSLPTRANLKRRKLLNADSCTHCNLDKETSLHAIWSCPDLKSIWRAHFDWLIKDSWDCSSLLDIIQLCQAKSNLTDLFAMTASLIWLRRNQLRVGVTAIPVSQISAMAVDNLLEFRLASPPPPPRAAPIIRTVKWSPPPPGWLKINFDGAIFSSKGLAGLGAIIRNDKGLVMAAYTQSIPLPTSVEMVEVLAARSAIGFLRELHFDQVIVEGDSEVIINAINKGGSSSSSYGHIIRDIKLASSAFQNLAFSHTRRLGNKVAHKLARLACNFSQLHVWMEDVPPDIVSVYLSDLPE